MTQEAIAAAKADIEATDERLAALPDFDVSDELRKLKAEMRDDG